MASRPRIEVSDRGAIFPGKSTAVGRPVCLELGVVPGRERVSVDPVAVAIFLVWSGLFSGKVYDWPCPKGGTTYFLGFLDFELHERVLARSCR